jgi:Cu-processing system permease protein
MNVYHIGRQQLTLILRSKWLLSFGLLFVLLAFFVTYFSQTGSSGFEGFNRMTASLLNLNLLLIPLISLLMGSLFLAGEKEDSGLMLLLTYPVYVQSVLMGKFFGLLVALGTVLTSGYGVSLLSMVMLNSEASVSVILKFYLLSFVLAAIFLALSVLIGIRAKSRFQALGISLVIWAVFVLFYEFMIMGISLFLTNQSILTLLSISIFVNPVEIIRVWSILALDGSPVFGPSLYDMMTWADGWKGNLLFSVSSIVWIFVPLWISSFLIKRGIEND